MSQPYIGEIRMFGGNYAPVGWAFCDGQLMPISENDTLFNLIGTTYGGDGQNTFGLPDLRSRVPIHAGSAQGITYQLGEQGGVESVTLTTSQIPVHNHAVIGATGNGSQANPNNNFLASSTLVKPYANESANNAMASNALAPQGGSQPHDNMQPFLVITYIIALYGIYPQQN